MNKKEVQQGVLQNGKPLALSKFSWDEKTRTFSSTEHGLVIDFTGVGRCTFKTGYACAFKTGDECTFNTEYACTFNTGTHCTFKAGNECTFNTENLCTFKAGRECTFNTGNECTFNTGTHCTFKTWDDCTFDTGGVCTFNTGTHCTFKTEGRCTFDTGDVCTFETGYASTFETGSSCTFDTGSHCTFDTGWGCTFKTGSHCTFDTGWGCTLNTGSSCTFKTGYECVIVRREAFEVIQPNEGDMIQLCPSGIKGHLVNGLYNGEPHIIADGILSKIVKKKGDVYKVINHGEEKETYLIERGGVFSHGDTISEAWDGLVYKLTEQDLSKYEGLTLASEVTHEEAIKMYRSITGACSGGTRYFIENNADKVKKSYTIEELLEAVDGRYGSEKFNQFFKGEK